MICTHYNCEADAVVRVFWPGKVPPPVYCLLHAITAEKILAAMGTPVATEKIDDENRSPNVYSECKINDDEIPEWLQNVPRWEEPLDVDRRPLHPHTTGKFMRTEDVVAAGRELMEPVLQRTLETLKTVTAEIGNSNQSFFDRLTALRAAVRAWKATDYSLHEDHDPELQAVLNAARALCEEK